MRNALQRLANRINLTRRFDRQARARRSAASAGARTSGS